MSQDTRHLVAHLFRHEAGRIVSTLTRVFGLDRIDLAEDVVQEALLKALQQWPYNGIPENPGAWIMQVAKNQALDVLRRERSLRDKEGEIVAEVLHEHAGESELFLPDDIEDDQLRMMFACCHPSLPPEAQVALTLKTLCGFGTSEIARAFLSNDETIHKRLVRARQRLREAKAAFEIPSGHDLARRRESVMQVLYLLFNEGYNASRGEELVRKELCEEAIRLCRLLAQHRAGNVPKAHALLALMLLHGSRLPARVDDLGNILLLKEQDRSLWNRQMISDGLRELDASAGGEEISHYHLEAGIAACHCLAESYEDTQWTRILTLYDMLVQVDDSPVISLNRAVALSHVRGPDEAIRAVEEMRNRTQLDGYYLLYAVLGEFHMALRNHEEAARNYRKALELTQIRSEQTLLSQRLEIATQSLN
jgi:RNA polymerase sigma-70 factor (ECF subfamily)